MSAAATELPEYYEDHGAPLENALNQLLGDERHRFVPIWENKSSPVSGETWSNGLTFAELSEGVKAGAWPGWAPTDLGVRLDRSGLIVLDLDVVRVGEGNPVVPGCVVRAPGTEPVLLGPGHAVLAGDAIYADGRAELQALVDGGLRLPRTLTLKTAGRPDRSHLPGRHLYYRQNPNWAVDQHGLLAPHVEVKVTGIARLTSGFEVLVDAPIAMLPDELARAVRPAGAGRPSRRNPSGPAGSGPFADYARAGVNNALTSIKGLIMGSGWWNEDQADQVVRLLNGLLADPMDARRLEGTVLREKGWEA